MSALPHGATVTWNSVAVSDVVDFSAPKAVTAVNCSTLGDSQEDNRAGLRNPSATVTTSIKNGNVWSIAEGDYGTLVVQAPVSGVLTEVFNEKLMLESVTPAGTVNGHQTTAFSFVSTEAVPAT